MNAKRRKGKLYIGTSNIVVPGNRQTFPEYYRDKSRLHYYSTLFSSLEVNSTFYKVPMPRTFEKWTGEVPQDFRFTVKMWKVVTHQKKLIYQPSDISSFLAAANHLYHHKGCLLVQFPGSITSDYSTEVFNILQYIREADPHDEWRIAVEFRHESWYIRETYELLNEYDAALVIHDIPASKVSGHNTDASFVYLRFHGPKGDYRDSYSTEQLSFRAKQISAWMREGKDVYAYFNNTIGEAYANARLLQDLVKQ
ncbi:MAG: DUF72 domain-containing protein [Chitinophagaceae bacterium]|nr:MAG: DUF72 domain-containing protein [Chitinophagaceae bacterium]